MINKLVDKIKKQNAPVVVGLDPMMKFIPEHLKKAAFEMCIRDSNTGLAHATGKYFKVVDSDDWVDLKSYRRVLATLKKFDEAEEPDMVIANYVYEKAVSYTHLTPEIS